MSNEIQRLIEGGAAETIDGPSILVVAQSANPVDSLNKVKEVLKLIASESVNGTWPNDDEWSGRLPSWFTEPFQGRTIEEVLADESLWDYGSWLDAVRHRGWQWWSSSIKGDGIRIMLQRDADVYSIEPLIYLAGKAARTLWKLQSITRPHSDVAEAKPVSMRAELLVVMFQHNRLAINLPVKINAKRKDPTIEVQNGCWPWSRMRKESA